MLTARKVVYDGCNDSIESISLVGTEDRDMNKHGSSKQRRENNASPAVWGIEIQNIGSKDTPALSNRSNSGICRRMKPS